MFYRIDKIAASGSASYNLELGHRDASGRSPEVVGIPVY